MARKRMIDPSIWQSEDFAQLSYLAKLVFIGLFSNADDEGRGRANAVYLKSILFPYDLKLLPEEIACTLQEIAGHMSVTFYMCEGKEYYQLDSWRGFQVINKPTPSKIPMDYGRDTVGLPSNRIEQNRIEKKGIEEKYTDFYSQNIGVMAPATAMQIQSFIDGGLTSEMILYALQKSVDANAKNWKYAKTILCSWQKKGFTSLKQAQAESVEFKNQSDVRAFPQHSYTEEQRKQRNLDAYKEMEAYAAAEPTEVQEI